MTPLAGLVFATGGPPRRAHALAARLLREHGAREGAPADLGVGAPGRVTLEVTGPASEADVAAAAGLWVPPVGRVRGLPVELGSWIAALHGCNAAVALLAAGRSGAVTVDAVGAALHAHELTFLFTDAPPPDQEPLRMAASPWIGSYPAADGYLFLHAGQPAHLARWLERLGDPGVSAQTRADPTRVGSVSEAFRTRRWLAARFRERACAAWEAESADLCLVAVRRPEHALVGIPGWTEGRPFAWEARGELPLSGLRVLDWTQVIAGPVAARTLAELGADVLRLDNPRLDVGWSEAFHAAFDAGKRVLRLDAAAARDALAAHDPHVVVEGLRAGVADRLGAVPPGDRVVSRVSAYGPGPWAARPGWEQTAQAVAGWQWAYGGQRPSLVPLPANDLVTGLVAAFRAIAGVYARRTDRFETALTETAGRLAGDAAVSPRAVRPRAALLASGLRRRVAVGPRTWTTVASPVAIDGRPLPEPAPAEPRGPLGPSRGGWRQAGWAFALLAGR